MLYDLLIPGSSLVDHGDYDSERTKFGTLAVKDFIQVKHSPTKVGGWVTVGRVGLEDLTLSGHPAVCWHSILKDNTILMKNKKMKYMPKGRPVLENAPF